MATPAEDQVPRSRRSRLSVQRRRRLTRTIVAALVLIAAVAGVSYAVTRGPDDPEPTSSAPTTTTSSPTTSTSTTPVPTTTTPSPTTTTPAAPTTSSGPTPSLAPVVTNSIPSPTASFGLEDTVPGTTNMQPAAAAAWTRLVSAAEDDGVTLTLKVGWRSSAWQGVLQRQARSDPTDERAGEWSRTPAQSPHVKGYAVDVTTRAAADWVAEEGSALGWCRPYEREWWHVEYLATSTCPDVTSSIAARG